MQGFLNKTYPFEFSLRRRLLFAIWGAIGFFLFILFFQPFGISQTNINNYILLIAGFGGIAFIIYSLVHLPVPWKRLSLKLGQYNLNIHFAFELLIWILNTVAFTFYLRYVGNVQLSIFLVFRISMITLFQLVINMMIYELYDLKLRLAAADNGDKNPDIKESAGSDDTTLEFQSVNASDKIRIKSRNLVVIRSAENYVEFCYRDGDSIKKKLLRTTLRSVEEQLSTHDSFVRCHRNSIVNISLVSKLQNYQGGFKLIIENYQEDLAVSRQYLLQVRKALDKRD